MCVCGWVRVRVRVRVWMGACRVDGIARRHRALIGLEVPVSEVVRMAAEQPTEHLSQGHRRLLGTESAPALLQPLLERAAADGPRPMGRERRSHVRSRHSSEGAKEGRECEVCEVCVQWGCAPLGM